MRRWSLPRAAALVLAENNVNCSNKLDGRSCALNAVFYSNTKLDGRHCALNAVSYSNTKLDGRPCALYAVFSFNV